jgi:hypothetical protein
LQLRPAHLARFLKLFVRCSCLLMFLSILTFLCLVFTSCVLAYCTKPGRQVFSPSIRVLEVLGLSCFYYSRCYGFFNEEFLYPLCSCLVVIMEFICDRVEFCCKLVSGGVRLPGSRAAHIFCSIIPSYPSVSCLIVRRWCLTVGMCLVAWCGVYCRLSPSQIRTHNIMYKIRTR